MRVAHVARPPELLSVAWPPLAPRTLELHRNVRFLISFVLPSPEAAANSGTGWAGGKA